MRIIKLEVTGFGPFNKWSSPELTEPVLIVCGPNESGKSSLFKLLVALLYGIYPAKRDNHPYTPWDGGELAGSALLRLGDGQEVEIYRRLRSQPEGILTWKRKGTVETLRNETVPFSRHVSRQLYEAVFALTLEQLSFPKEQIWAELEDNLLGGFGSGWLRPVREVVTELEYEASKLWRTDRRGSPEDREKGDRLRRLRDLAREAKLADEALRQKVAAAQEAELELQLLQAETIRIKADLRRANRLAPVWKKLTRIEKLVSEAGSVEDHDHLPEDPALRLRELDEKLAELQDDATALRDEQERQLEIKARFTENDRRALSKETEIEGWQEESGRISADRDQLENLRTRLTGLNSRIETEAQDLLSQPWKPEMAEPLSRLAVADLKARLDDCERAEEALRNTLTRYETLKARAGETPAGGLSFASLVLSILGLIVLVSGLVSSVFLLSVLGVMLLLPGAARLWAWLTRLWARLTRGRRPDEISEAEVERAEADLRRTEKHLETARAAVAGLFAGLPVAGARLERPDQSLLADVRALRATLRDIEGLQTEIKTLRDRLDSRESAVTELAAELELVPEPDLTLKAAPAAQEPLATIRSLAAALLKARQHLRDAEAAEERLREIEEGLARITEREKLLSEERERLAGELSRLGDGDVSDGIVLLAKRREAHRDAMILRKELEREHPDLEDVIAEIDTVLAEQDASLVFSDEEVVRLEQQEEQNQELIKTQAAKVAALEKEIETLREQVSLDVLEGEIESLEEERRSIRRRRDQLMLLRGFLVEADRRFREEHQPDVLRLASSYLEKITDGRYDRLYLEEGTAGPARQELKIRQRHGAFPLTVGEPLSRGTLDQIYLALRLALIDHLDAGHERLPLFLDEVLVNWDGVRREHGVEIIRQVAETRQVFLFTCHHWLAEEMEETLPAQLLQLKAARADFPAGGAGGRTGTSA